MLQLVEAGCHVAICDLSADEIKETATHGPGDGTERAGHDAPLRRVDEEAILAFRDEVVTQHETDHVHLLFNNAGLSGGGSLFTDTASLLGSVLRGVLGRRVLRHPGVP